MCIRDSFKSETDTEVVAHLVEESYHRMLAEGTGDLRAAVAEAAARLVGAYGLAVMADAEPVSYTHLPTFTLSMTRAV